MFVVESVADSCKTRLKQTKEKRGSALHFFEPAADFTRYITLYFKTWLSRQCIFYIYPEIMNVYCNEGLPPANLLVQKRSLPVGALVWGECKCSHGPLWKGARSQSVYEPTD